MVRKKWEIRKCGYCTWRLVNGTGELCDHCKKEISSVALSRRKGKDRKLKSGWGFK